MLKHFTCSVFLISGSSVQLVLFPNVVNSKFDGSNFFGREERKILARKKKVSDCHFL